MAMCYRDRLFCGSPKCANKCGRKLTPELEADAEKWWLDVTHGRSKEAPIAYAELCDENGEYKS